MLVPVLDTPLACSTFEEFMEDYREAVFRNDIDAMTATYNFPLVFHDAAELIVISDVEAAQKAALLMRRFYDDLGMACLETRFVSTHRISQDFVLVDVVWRLRDRQSMMICDQRSTYALRETVRGTKIVAVFLHEDILPRYGNA